MILPRSFRRFRIQRQIDASAKLLHDSDIPLDAFTLGGKPFKVGCCFQVWGRDEAKADLRLHKAPESKHPDFQTRVYNAQNDPGLLTSDWWSLALYRTGYADYSPLRRGTILNPKRQYILIQAEDHVVRRLSRIDYNALARRYTTTPGFALPDVVEAYKTTMRQCIRGSGLGAVDRYHHTPAQRSAWRWGKR